MTAPPRRIAWIVAPPDICCLCKEPLGRNAEVSSWNGAPAHRECVRVHLVQRDPAFRDWGHDEETSEESADSPEDANPREDDDEDFS